MAEDEAKDNSTSDPGSEKVILGKITGVYGVKGWVKIFSYTEPMEAIVEYSPWYIRAGNIKNTSAGEVPWREVKLKSGKRHAKTVVAKLEHCNDRDQAMVYVGTEIAIELQQLERLREKNEYYWRDLIGLRVINQQDIELGVVKSLLETGANDVLVVSEGEGTDSEKEIKQHLIPWTMDIAIITVDMEKGLIVVDWDADF
ncbi:MAG TPA: ribosome maturation factor RimM [Gammaproteobacteria bacterium]|nr:ribosome maturation factor RimM [Gammaproteobacteria bacterium]